jgi:glycosyltransferase involved in cell wall biosynthesis
MSDGFSIICLSPQEWHVDLPTNRQHVMFRAARHGHDVVFVETGYFLGRQLAWALRRRDGSFLRRMVVGEEVAPRVRVRKAPNLLPWGKKYRLPNSVNGFLTAALVRRLARRLPDPVVLWIYDPTSARIAGRCGEAFSVYDCVDDYVEQNGANLRRRALVAEGDERAANVSRLVFATTGSLYERKRRLNSRTHLVPNGSDFDHFHTASDRSIAASELEAAPRPIVGFAGNLTAAKVDFSLLEQVAESRPAWTFVLVGPVRRDAEIRLARLVRLPNVHALGEKAYAELPRYVAAFDVGVIPYVSTAYTRACFPLKLYEYLAAGKPVVASGVPELSGMEPDVLVVDGAEAFTGAIESALARDSEDDRARRFALAARNTWETRTGRLLELIGEELTA